MMTNLKEILWCDLRCILESDYEPEVRAQARFYLAMLDGIEDEKDLDPIFDFCGYEDCRP